MNLEKARDLLWHTGELVQLVSRFQALYGRGYRLNPGSDDDAWQLLEKINRTQLRLALLLDAEILEQAYSLNGCWWEGQDIPDVSAVQSLISQTGHLITACTYASLHESRTAVNATQRTIAGILHPAIRLMAQQQQAQQIAS